MYQDVVRELLDFMKESGKSQQQVAKEAALSTSVISQFIKQSYKGNNEEVARTILKYLEMARLQNTGTRHTCFYEGMHNTRAVVFACHYAHRHGDISLIFGDAGAGKTTALKLYTEEHPGVVMVTANSCTSSAASVLQMIGSRTGRTLPGKKEAMMSALVDYFKDTGRLVIIDEADHLTMSALQAVRNLNDQAGIGVILSGNTKIYTQLLQGPKCSELQQLRQRIVVRRMVRNEYGLEEFKEIFPDVPGECLPYLVKLANDESLRATVKILELAYEFADTKNISVKILKQVKMQLTEGL